MNTNYPVAASVNKPSKAAEDKSRKAAIGFSIKGNESQKTAVTSKESMKENTSSKTAVEKFKEKIKPAKSQRKIIERK